MKGDSVGSTGGGGLEGYILIRDEKAAGTNGGTFTAGAWRTRDLTVEVNDDGNHASLSANQITLAAGTYWVEARAPAQKVSRNKCKLVNITDAVDLIVGASSFTSSGDNTQVDSYLEGEIILPAPKVIELQHRCEITANTNGFGVNSNMGAIEVYSVIEFWKQGE